MRATRITFLVAIFALLTPVFAQTASVPVAETKPLKVLILGGTAFPGPAVVDAAKARGHSVTIFNRGKTEKRIGKIDGVGHLFGNRDPDKAADEADPSSPKGLDQLKEGTWDVVIDTSGYYPRHVKASAELLAPRVKQYIFISSVSVYTSNDTPGADESAPVGSVDDPEKEVMTDGRYGPLKAMCETAAEKAMPGRVCTIRPGFIVGPGDSSDRFTYWVVRGQRGGEMLAPGTPRDPIQLIDVRDLAEFIVRCAEKNTNGVFNALGPAEPLKWGEVLAACLKAGGKKSEAKLTWIDEASVIEMGMIPGADLPIWLPSTGEAAGFHRRSVAKAEAAGLKFRPIQETVDALALWWPKEVASRTRVGKELTDQALKDGKPAPKLGDPLIPRAGLTESREAAELKAWHDKLGIEKK